MSKNTKLGNLTHILKLRQHDQVAHFEYHLCSHVAVLMWHTVVGTGKHCNMYSGLQYELISNTNLVNLYFVQFLFEWLTSGHSVPAVYSDSL